MGRRRGVQRMFQGGGETERTSQAEGTACAETQRLEGVYLRNGDAGSWLHTVGQGFGDETMSQCM